MKTHPSQVTFQFRPIHQWTHGRGPKRDGTPFRATPGQTQNDLKCELAAIGVSHAVIQADLHETDIRLDGMPRAGAAPASGRVILSFKHPKMGEISMPCWATPKMWDNIRAIVKTLEALRAVDRYGVTQRAEQYRGWSVLPPAGTVIVASQFVTVEDAARFLIETAGEYLSSRVEPHEIIAGPTRLRIVFHAAASVAHPDAGGSDALMRKVNAARDMIERAQKGQA